ncbi:MAG: flagellar hook-associated protein FlgK [Nitrospinae bacterium]|nr:flagellar hook-associated protein FlgK [Nitrospinota bacterium]
MPNIQNILEVGKRALVSQQEAINVTGHNIANVNTPGFSRQRPVFVPTPSLDSPAGQVGTGVKTAMIERVFDRFVAAQISAQIQVKGKAEAKKDTLDQVDSILNEASGPGLNQALSDFWNAWRDVTTDPFGPAERSALVAKTTILTQTFRDLDSRLATLQTDLNTLISSKIQKVNLLAEQIAGLNLTIKQQEVGGQPANDLRDQQRVLVDELADLLPVQIFEQPDGQVIMQVAGHPLVDGLSTLQLTTSLVSGSLRVQWLDRAGTPADITDQLSQSKMGGWIAARDTLLADYRGRLNTLAAGLIEAVNRVHSNGIGLTPFSSLTSTYPVSSTSAALSSTTAALPFGGDIVDGSFKVFAYDKSGAVIGSGTVAITKATTSLADVQTALSAIPGITASIDTTQGTLTISGVGSNTFAFAADTSNVLMALGLNTLFTGKEARDIAVNPVVGQSPDRLATAKVEASGVFAKGDNRSALAVTALQRTSLPLGGTTSTLDDFYGALVGQVGIDGQRAERELMQQQSLVEQLTNRRDTISGVSLDEEMTNLIKFQHAYGAAAKLVSLVDEMLRTVIGMV